MRAFTSFANSDDEIRGARRYRSTLSTPSCSFGSTLTLGYTGNEALGSQRFFFAFALPVRSLSSLTRAEEHTGFACWPGARSLGCELHRGLPSPVTPPRTKSRRDFRGSGVGAVHSKRREHFHARLHTMATFAVAHQDPQ